MDGLAVGLSWTGDGLGCSMGCLRPAEMDGKVAGCECGVGGRLKGCGEGAVKQCVVFFFSFLALGV